MVHAEATAIVRVVTRTGLLALSLAVGLVVLASVYATGAAADSADDLLARVAEARALAERALDDPRPEHMDEVRERTGGATDVDVAGAHVTIAPGADLAALDGETTADFETAAAHLRLVETELAAATGRPAADRAAIDDAVETAYAGIRSELTVFEQLNRFIGDLLLRLISATAGAEGWLRLLLIAAVSVLTVALAVWIVRRLGLVREERTDDGGGGGHVVDPDWHAISDDALARGDLDAALRAAYRGLLATLDARDLLRDRPSLTAAETRRLVTDVGDLRPRVEAATITFERVVYADEPASRGSVETIREADQVASRR